MMDNYSIVHPRNIDLNLVEQRSEVHGISHLNYQRVSTHKNQQKG